jgi:hypothetical protein
LYQARWHFGSSRIASSKSASAFSTSFAHAVLGHAARGPVDRLGRRQVDRLGEIGERILAQPAANRAFPR